MILITSLKTSDSHPLHVIFCYLPFLELVVFSHCVLNFMCMYFDVDLHSSVFRGPFDLKAYVFQLQTFLGQFLGELPPICFPFLELILFVCWLSLTGSLLFMYFSSDFHIFHPFVLTEQLLCLHLLIYFHFCNLWFSRVFITLLSISLLNFVSWTQLLLWYF